jgi:predicted transcriptional regulator
VYTTEEIMKELGSRRHTVRHRKNAYRKT